MSPVGAVMTIMMGLLTELVRMDDARCRQDVTVLTYSYMNVSSIKTKEAVQTQQNPRAGRGRRPAAEVRTAALEAAADLLFGEGISAVTHERVASLAGVSKTTLYKWWPSPGALASDAYFERSAPYL